VCFLIGCGNPVDGLVRQLQDSDVDVRRKAATTLLQMRGEAKPAIPALTSALQDDDREVRRLASRALGQLSPEAASSVSALQRLLNDPEPSVRIAAAFAIQELDPAETSHRKVLIDAMKMGEGGTIVAVGKHGANAKWAVPTLVSLLEDRRPGIRRLAADALGRIGPAAADAQDALRQASSKDADDRVRDAARVALSSITER
jgi:HEAT repeat protein